MSLSNVSKVNQSKYPFEGAQSLNLEKHSFHYSHTLSPLPPYRLYVLSFLSKHLVLIPVHILKSLVWESPCVLFNCLNLSPHFSFLIQPQLVLSPRIKFVSSTSLSSPQAHIQCQVVLYCPLVCCFGFPYPVTIHRPNFCPVKLCFSFTMQNLRLIFL